jgi:hypothetical protein
MTYRDKIGEAAGQIWHLLNNNGALTMTRLKKEIQSGDALVLQGLGWLAREEKVEFTEKGKSVTIRLK